MRSICLAMIAGVLCLVMATQAQDLTPTPTPETPGQPVATLVEVIVTGSNIPTAEEVGPQPVYRLNKDEIFQLGVRSATDFVQKLPIINGIAINENLNADGDGHVEIDLRGIGPRETLVLQDGRRLAPVGFAAEIGFSGATVDLNMIPLGLIDHIDILKDGASSIYGSDAVAGVVNVSLIHKFRDVEIYSSYGNTNLGASNDQAEKLAYVLAGTGDDKTDIVVYAESYSRDAIYSRDRNISSNADFTRFGGLDNRSPDFAGRVGDFVYQPRLNGGAASPTGHAFPDVANDPQYVPLSSLPRAQQAFNSAAFTPAVAPVDREYFYGSLDRKIFDQYLELVADFKYIRGFWDSGFEPVEFTPDVFTDATHPAGISPQGISVPIQNPFNPFTVADYTSPGGTNPKFPETRISAVPPGTPLTTGVHYAALEAGSRTDEITAHNYEFTGGLKGNLGEFGDYFKTWQWESGFRYNEDDRTQLLGGIVNNNALRAALLDTNPATAFNPFGINKNSPAVLNKVFVTASHLGKASLTLEDLKVTGNHFTLPAGPISFAIGGEHRTEDINDQPDALLASGQTIGAAAFVSDFSPINGNLPVKGSRDVWSIYWEVLLPVTSPLWNCFGLYSLELGYQERFDNYSDFGSTERPKFFVRWQPVDSSLTLRATFNEAYRAPTLGELFTSQAQISVLSESVRDPAGLTPPGTAIKETIGGNPNLTPEVAYEWTYGAVWTPAKLIKGLTLSADFYHIDLRNGVFILDDSATVLTNFITRTGTLPNGAPTGGVYSDLIRRDPVTGAIQEITLTPQNQSRIITEGLDYEASYQLDTSIFSHGDFGTFTSTFNGNYLARWRHKPVPGENDISTDGQFIGPRRGALAKDRWFTSLFYDLGGLDAGATVHFSGQMYDKNPNLPIPLQRIRKIREWTTLDLIVNYTFNLPASAQNEVAGYAMDGGKNAEMKDRKRKNVSPVSSAEYNPCGWRAWLNNTTITLGMNNVLDQDPPFVAANGENGYNEWQANIRGRTWYVALKKRF
ncbi:MAG: iron complex outerrane recepter protein [Verrucomicrobiota bacterium]|jgi:iron complex outermembrane receptor protein